MPEMLLRLLAVLARTGLSRSALYRGMDEGTFPRSVAIGKNSAAWVASQVDGWIDARITEARRLPWRASGKLTPGKRTAPEQRDQLQQPFANATPKAERGKGLSAPTRRKRAAPEAAEREHLATDRSIAETPPLPLGKPHGGFRGGGGSRGAPETTAPAKGRPSKRARQPAERVLARAAAERPAE
jgi:prophage regulatory protein